LSKGVKNSPLCDNEPVTIVDLIDTDKLVTRYEIEVLEPNANKTIVYAGDIIQTKLSSLGFTACQLKFA